MALTLFMIGPRLGHAFPSLVDDWYAIDRTPSQIGQALLLGSPEPGRYRPGWIVWNHLQWHTFGGPETLTAARVWGVVRAMAVPTGIFGALVVAALDVRDVRRRARLDLLAVALCAAVLTTPALAEDIARYGPQEPLLVGFGCLGGALVALALARAFRSGVDRWASLLVVGGLVGWIAGVSQKESAVCVLAAVPFLVPPCWSRREAWRALPRRTRRFVVVVLAASLLPLIVMLARTIQAGRQDELVYGADPGADLVDNAVTIVRLAQPVLGSPIGACLFVAASAGLAWSAVTGRRVDWLGLGLLASGLSFLVFASQAGVVVSRYYLPALVLTALALVRAATRLPRSLVTAAALVLALVSIVQLPLARSGVARWLDVEQLGEELVREAGGIRAGGCAITVTGPDVEMVEALPVLVRYVDRPHACDPARRYLVVVTGFAREGTDPLVARCGSDAEKVFANRLGRIMRCTTDAAEPS